MTAAHVDEKRVFPGRHYEYISTTGPYSQRPPRPSESPHAQPYRHYRLPPSTSSSQLPPFAPSLNHDSRGVTDAPNRALTLPPPFRPGYDTPMISNRSYNDTTYTRTPSSSSQPGSAVDAHSRSLPLNDQRDHDRRSMDVDQYASYRGSDQHSNMHDFSYPQQHNGFDGSPYGSHPLQASGLHYDNSTPYGGAYDGMSGNQPARKRGARATQACGICRTKKAKCDEQRPTCGTCLQSNAQCVYRDIPPPKHDRSFVQIIDQVNKVDSRIDNVTVALETLRHDMLEEFRKELRYMRVQQPTEWSQSPTRRPNLSMSAGLEDPRDHSNLTATDLNPRRRQSSEILQQSDPQYHSSSRNGSYGSQQGRLVHKPLAAFTPMEEMDEIMDNELSIPPEHTTAAHKLFTEWDSIKVFLENVTDYDYVMRGEANRGLLRLNGRGQGNDGSDRNVQYAPAPSHVPHLNRDDSSSTISSPADGYWGVPFGSTPPSIHVQRYPPYTSGGLNADESLCLDVATCQRLLDNYLVNMHVMHPFLDRKQTNRKMDKFARRYGPDPALMQSPGFVPHHAGFKDSLSESGTASTGSKRKRSYGTIPDIPSSMLQGRTVTRTPIERSIDSAILLLILALGKICEHEGPLPAPVDDTDHLPEADKVAFGMRDCRFPNGGQMPFESRAPDVRNVDKIPGLAYYTQAAGILGELVGGNKLEHVHAFLLAGLYMGQMARVFESWKWISLASSACLVLIKQNVEHHVLTHDAPDQKVDSIRMAWWVCWQLESDIVAELDVPQSGISRLENRVPLPKGPALNAHNEADNIVMLYYNAQAYLRRLLNRAHSALYCDYKGKLRRPEWSVVNAKDLLDGLDEWKNKLPEALKWEDNEPPARDINAARLRGKYYGARYMMARPFLHHAHAETEKRQKRAQMRKMHASESLTVGGASSKEDDKLDQKVSTYAQTCIEAACSSTTAFDGIWPAKRLIVTNIFGTAHAQFGNMLVLAATYKSPSLHWLIPDKLFTTLMDRTITFLSELAPISPTMQMNVKILQNAKRIATKPRAATLWTALPDGGVAVKSAASSFGNE